MKRRTSALLATPALAVATMFGAGAATAQAPQSSADAAAAPVRVHLTPSSAQLAACIPHVNVNVSVKLQTEALGRDVFDIYAAGMPKNTSFTVFLLEKAGLPFGAAEYIGDFTTDQYGRAHNQYKLIVEEAFASTLVGTTRVREELNRIGVWFADPKDDDFCIGGADIVTPFDGDDEAGVQILNSAKSRALP